MFNKDTTLILGDGFLASEFIRQGYKNFTSRKFKHYDDIDSQYYGEVFHSDQNVIYFDAILISKSIRQVVADLLLAVKTKYPNITTIINCIGIADTRFCEQKENFKIISLINGELVEHLSSQCSIHGLKFVQVSSGCLYDRRSGLVKETDFLAAHCNYVVSKWIGEMGCDPDSDLIIRPRLYFSHHENRLNLICKLPKFKTILNELNSVTSTRTIVEAVTALLENNQSGIFNVANDGAYTIKQLSEAIGYKWTDDQVVNQEELHKSQGLYLVNNVMDLSKLKQFYTPRDAIEEFKWCAANLK